THARQLLHASFHSTPGSDITSYSHSFPTRRSSDLERSGVSCGRCFSGKVCGRAPLPGAADLRCCRHDPSLPPLQADPRRRARSRSEEHTSELQSPDHLVCRLLLETKKQHARTVTVD